MEWILLAVMGLVFGFVARFIAMFNSEIRLGLCLALGTVGALAGGALYNLTRTPMFGASSFYVVGAILSFMFLAGGLFAFTLTHREKRV